MVNRITENIQFPIRVNPPLKGLASKYCLFTKGPSRLRTPINGWFLWKQSASKCRLRQRFWKHSFFHLEIQWQLHSHNLRCPLSLVAQIWWSASFMSLRKMLTIVMMIFPDHVMTIFSLSLITMVIFPYSKMIILSQNYLPKKFAGIGSGIFCFFFHAESWGYVSRASLTVRIVRYKLGERLRSV